MSQINLTRLLITAGLALALGGCGDKNDKAVFSPDGGHLTGWVTTHKTSAKADLETCVECHGESLDGGKSKVSCTKCHPAGPTSKHPLSWGAYAFARHKVFVAANDTSTCENAACHGVLLAGVPGSGPACATACHLGGLNSKHPAVWVQYSSHGNYIKAKQYDSSSCSTSKCHGTDAKGVFLSGPSCFVCHPASPAVVAPVPDKHPHDLVVNGHFNHKQYLNIPGASAACLTSICHGPGARGPSCGTSGCHN